MAQPLMAAPDPIDEATLWKGTPSPTLLAGHIALIVAVLVLLPLFIRFFASTMPDEQRAASMMRFGWITTGVLVAIQLVALAIAWIRLRSTAYVVTNQRVLIEHIEIANYGTARTFAETLGYTHAAELLQQTLEEERAIDQKLTQLAERFVNPKAIRA